MSFMSIKMQAEPMKSLAFGAISPVYALLGTLDNPSRVLYFNNLTDKLLHFSFDGVHDHFSLPAAGYFVLDESANRTGPTEQLFFAQGQRIYVRCDAGPGVPTAGTVNVSTFYGANV